jgi:nitrite reductase/ring-hydroxylating ferredoxin subunit
MAEFRKVLRRSEVPEGRGRAVEVDGERIAVFQVGGVFYAVADLCTHEEAHL